jgi:serine/threonine protein kinase
LCQQILDGLAAQEMPAESAALVDPDRLPRLQGFKIARELGRGGMGAVFLAREIRPDRDVAIKFLCVRPLNAVSSRP